MISRFDERISRKSIFAWIALATGLVLLVPLIAMQFTGEVNWHGGDFIAMGALLFGTASLFVLAARRSSPGVRLAIGGLLAVAFLYLWAELAVGVFTNLAS